jgi:hypothetical protein
MKITIATSLVPNKELISDTDRGYKLEPEKEYILHFTTGRVTMQAFKELYLLGRQICFYVVNFEYFIHKLGFFKNCEFCFLRDEESCPATRMEVYRSIEKGMVGEARDIGVELSFRPDVFRSIRSSLVDPTLYMSSRNISSVIYSLLEKGMEYEELKRRAKLEIVRAPERKTRTLPGNRKLMPKVLVEKFDENFDRSLKSLIYAEIVKKKGELFYV